MRATSMRSTSCPATPVPRPGRLSLVERQSTLGKTPREFIIDPSGRWLIVGNQDSDGIYVFRREIDTGRLEPDPQKIALAKPADFKLIPVR